MNQEQRQENFVYVYDKYADEVFAYCHKVVAQRDNALQFTYTIFARFWEQIMEQVRLYGESVHLKARHLRLLLNEVAKDEMARFAIHREHTDYLHRNLWNLTLTQ